ncbi:hypothetical protein LTR37_021141 [Vermiconidia calcicola]|uniref:Uncharacterized protein n=1 Tax=Vermiconidia calcicola TaxID=1690605 RepID=A0ACC3M9A2_9PEZI|nr:hypothetical protein LTR37_021141 [Vermiconidia calcicola]
MPHTTAMLFALTSPHQSLSLDDFNTCVCRFRAEDDTSAEKAEALRKGGSLSTRIEAWSCLAMYELENEEALKTDQYKKAREEDGDDESKMFDFLSRRVYKVLSDKRRDDYAQLATSGRTRYMTVVSLQPDPSSELSTEEFHDWYEQEH